MSDERLNLPSASSMERLALCPASRTLELSQPDRESKEADLGEVAHDLASRYFALIGSDLAWPPFAQELYAGMDLHISDVVERFVTMAAAVYDAWAARTDALPKQKIIVERRIVWSDENFAPLTTGKPDVVWVTGRHALILDLKSLNGEHTESVRNLQLRTYALLVSKKYGCTNVTVAICQPIVSSKPQVVLYDAELLAKAEIEIVGYLRASESPDAPLLAGPKQCRHCRARAVCPAAREFAMMPAVVPQRELKKGEAARIVSLLSVEERLSIRANKGTIERILKAVDENLYDLPAAELAEHGWEVKKKPGNREVNDGPGAWLALKEVLTPDAWNRCCSVGISKIEGEVRAATHLPVKDVKALVEKSLGELISRKADGRELVRLKESAAPTPAVLEQQPVLELQNATPTE